MMLIHNRKLNGILFRRKKGFSHITYHITAISHQTLLISHGEINSPTGTQRDQATYANIKCTLSSQAIQSRALVTHKSHRSCMQMCMKKRYSK